MGPHSGSGSLMPQPLTSVLRGSLVLGSRAGGGVTIPLSPCAPSCTPGRAPRLFRGRVAHEPPFHRPGCIPASLGPTQGRGLGLRSTLASPAHQPGPRPGAGPQLSLGQAWPLTHPKSPDTPHETHLSLQGPVDSRTPGQFWDSGVDMATPGWGGGTRADCSRKVRRVNTAVRCVYFSSSEL